MNKIQIIFSCLVAYTQDTIKGDADNEQGHVHEGIQLAARDGFVAVGDTLEGNPKKVFHCPIIILEESRICYKPIFVNSCTVDFGKKG